MSEPCPHCRETIEVLKRVNAKLRAWWDEEDHEHILDATELVQKHIYKLRKLGGEHE